MQCVCLPSDVTNLAFFGVKAHSGLVDLLERAANMIASTRRDNGSRVEESREGMKHEIDPKVIGDMEEERLRRADKTVTDVLKRADVDWRVPGEIYSWAWRRKGRSSVMTIWAEDVHAVDRERWLTVEKLDGDRRRSGKPWKSGEAARSERRSSILRESARQRAPLLGVLQVNRFSAEQLVHDDATSKVEYRVADRTPWHVTIVPGEKTGEEFAVLLRGEKPWAPTPAQIAAARARWEDGHQTGRATPGSRPSESPFLAINVAWMKRYEGRTEEDPVSADNFGYFGRLGNPPSDAHEQWNFADTEGSVYGYVPRSSSISVQRLGAPPSADHVDGVLVVFFSRDPAEDVLKVVGWYQHARVHRQPAYTHQRSGLTIGSSIRADKSDTMVLPVADRTVVIPTAQTVPGGVGQSPLWYADEHPDKVAEIRALVASLGGKLSGAGNQKGRGSPRQPDIAKRLAVEQAAMDMALKYYDGSEDVSKAAHGWDVEAQAVEGTLLIEVKGLSGQVVSVELTPNEYSKSQEHRDRYVIFVVTGALTQKPLAHIFRFHAESDSWRTAGGQVLQFKELIAARAFL